MPDSPNQPLQHLRFHGTPLVLNYRGTGRGKNRLQVKGWWATRKFPDDHEHHDCHLRQIRYSLLVSIESEANLPIYTEIEAAMLEIPIPAEIPASP